MPARIARICSNASAPRLLATILIGLCAPSIAQATVNIDLRAYALNGAPLSRSQVKNVRAAHVGDVVSFDVYAIVVGQNTSLLDDEFISIQGSFRSAGAVQGNLVLDIVRTASDQTPGGDGAPIAGFDGLGAFVGTQHDLDGDGDLDVGSNFPADPTDFWSAEFALSPAGAQAGSTNPARGGKRIGFGTFTITGVTGDGVTSSSLNFFGRDDSSALRYIQDGVILQSTAPNGMFGLTVLAPEPATLSFAAATGLLAIARPRRRD